MKAVVAAFNQEKEGPSRGLLRDYEPSDGTFSSTNSHTPALLQLVTREDTLKEKHSGPGCDKLRTITKNCKDKEEREGGEYSVFSLEFKLSFHCSKSIDFHNHGGSSFSIRRSEKAFSMIVKTDGSFAALVFSFEFKLSVHCSKTFLESL